MKVVAEIFGTDAGRTYNMQRFIRRLGRRTLDRSGRLCRD